MTTASAASRPPRALVVIAGDDVYEDLFGAADKLKEILTGSGFSVRVAMGMNRFSFDFGGTSETDVVVLYTAVGEFPEDAQRGLADAVAGGVGLLAVHASNVLSPATESIALELIGSRYASHGPQPHESRFTVHFDPAHALTTGLDEFDITHEHYQLEIIGRPEVLAWRDTATGREPLLHVSEVGRGRVCYLQLGHDMRTWDDPAVQTIITRAAGWLSSAGHQQIHETEHAA
jgi:type 1 glutamine amidotransferase